MHMLHGLHKLILSTRNMAERVKQDVHWWKETTIYFILF